MDLIEIAENARLMMHNRGTLECKIASCFLSLRLFNAIAMRGKGDVFVVYDGDDEEDRFSTDCQCHSLSHCPTSETT